MSHKRVPPVAHDDPNMVGQRSRNATGELRRKRGDTLVGNIEDQNHMNFHVRSDMKLDTLRDLYREESLARLIEAARHRR